MNKLSYTEAEELLESYGIDTVESEHADKEETAVSQSVKIGFPVVMKVDSPSIIHKSDKGYVETDLDTEKKVKKAFNEMKKKTEEENAEFNGVVLQKQLDGKEIIIGGKRDPQFGPAVLFGMGGVFVELFEDTSLRITPIDKEEALEMMEETKAYRLLNGYRGEEPVNIQEIAETIVKIGKLMMNEPQIKEMDLNPLVANTNTAKAVDLRIIKESKGD